MMNQDCLAQARGKGVFKIMGIFLGIPIIRIMVFCGGGVYLGGGPPIQGSYQMHSRAWVHRLAT